MNSNAVWRFVIEPARAEPEAVAVIDAATGRTYSRAEMLEGTKAAASAYLCDDVQPEQRVMICCADTASFLWCFWGAMWIGAVPVPVSTMLKARDYEFLLHDSRAAGLAYSPEFASEALGAIADQRFLRWAYSISGVDPEKGPFRDPHQSDDDLFGPLDVPDDWPPDPYPSTDDDTAFWLYTSGTTGQPKGAMHRHIDMGACTDLYAAEVLGMGADDLVYSVAKLFFAYGLGNAGYFPAGTGAAALLNPGRPTPEDIARHVRTHRPTLYFGVPTSYAQLLAADLPSDTFESVRLGVSAGEPLPAEVAKRFRSRFGVEILDGLGTTEIAHIAVSNRAGASVPGTSGTPVEGYEVSLRDEAGLEVPDGEPGALYVAGPSVMTGYWNRTEQNRRALHGRFMATGDTYVRNPDGTYTCLGRTDDMMKVSGIWVSPAEVEACILEMESVVSAAVVGAPDESGLIKPNAFVVPAPGADAAGLPAAVQAHVRERLAPYKYPRWVQVVDELPQTATGKIKRYLLRDS